MEILFISNYFNHHQAPLAAALDQQTDHHFAFVETQLLPAERAAMGWGQEEKPPYVLQLYKDRQIRNQIQKRIDEADVVIWGACDFALIRPRLRKKKLTFAYSERIFKKGYKGIDYWGRAVKYWLRLAGYQQNHYLLCASAYAADDYSRLGLFRGRAYRWGYFPLANVYDVRELMANKQKNERPSILWVARMIGWKHPETAIRLAEELKNKGCEFDLWMIGNGPLEDKIRYTLREKQLEGCVHLLGTMSPEEVRCHMERADIFLFSSDQNEGWGAVLNESMNSGCAVIANRAIGSVPFLIQDGKNGLTYGNDGTDELVDKAVYLLENADVRKELGISAYKTISESWNADTACDNLMQLIREIACGTRAKTSDGEPASKITTRPEIFC